MATDIKNFNVSEFSCHCGCSGYRAYKRVVPDTNMFSIPMNEINTKEGGYVGTKMRTGYGGVLNDKNYNDQQ